MSISSSSLTAAAIWRNDSIINAALGMPRIAPPFDTAGYAPSPAHRGQTLGSMFIEAIGNGYIVRLQMNPPLGGPGTVDVSYFAPTLDELGPVITAQLVAQQLKGDGK